MLTILQLVIKAHTAIVSSSPVLTAMFQNNFKESHERIVDIVDMEADVIETMLQFMYTGNVDLEKVNVAGLLKATDKYAIDSLKEECVNYLSANLSVENALECLILSHTHSITYSHERTFDFMLANSRVISSRFKANMEEAFELYPELCLTLMQVLTLRSSFLVEHF